MTAAELRKALEGVPDDMLVVSYDEGYLTKDVSAHIQRFAPLVEGQIEEAIWSYSGKANSGHPVGTIGAPYFLVA